MRDLAVSELIVAGDCVDRGPRGDRVVEYLRHQPNVSFTWGNHDVAWIGAALGQEALIAHVLRISIRYRRLSQLEEGYGITLQPLEHLVRTVYKDDPAESFAPKGTRPARDPDDGAHAEGGRDHAVQARGPDDRAPPGLAAGPPAAAAPASIPRAGTVEIDGKTHAAARPAASPPSTPPIRTSSPPRRRKCMDRLRRSFLASPQLWEHVRFLVERGSMWLRRDDHLIFHGCVPVDDEGRFLSMTVDGEPRAGRALFDALERVVVRSLESPCPRRPRPALVPVERAALAPFGKDRITTLERDLVADPATHHETKNPYFKLIHEAAFCERVLQEFGCDPARGLIVNGHVPVKIDKGEDPLKRSGKAITIDGAFSEAYGDHGYTLVLEADRTFLGRHHHFDSVEAAVRDGVDIIPTIAVVREWDRAAAGGRHGARRGDPRRDRAARAPGRGLSDERATRRRRGAGLTALNRSEGQPPDFIFGSANESPRRRITRSQLRTAVSSSLWPWLFNSPPSPL